MSFSSSNQGVATAMFTVTPSDTVNFPRRVRRLFVTVGGALSVVDGEGNTTVFSNYPELSYLDAEILRVNNTGTTATGLIGFV